MSKSVIVDKPGFRVIEVLKRFIEVNALTKTYAYITVQGERYRMLRGQYNKLKTIKDDLVRLGIIGKRTIYFVSSSKYYPIDNSVAFATLHRILSGAFEVKRYSMNNLFMLAEFVSRQDYLDDGVSLMVWAYNRNNAKTSFKIGAGWYEFICSNGVMVGRTAKVVKFIHLYSEEALRTKLLTAIFELMNEQEVVKGVIAGAKNIAVPLKLLKEVIRKKYLKTMVPKYVHRLAYNELARGHYEFVSLWEVIRAYSYVASNELYKKGKHDARLKTIYFINRLIDRGVDYLRELVKR